MSRCPFQGTKTCQCMELQRSTMSARDAFQEFIPYPFADNTPNLVAS